MFKSRKNSRALISVKSKFVYLLFAIVYLQDMQDDMEDLFEQNQEIQEVMSRSYGGMDDVCDADLEAGLYSRTEAN